MLYQLQYEAALIIIKQKGLTLQPTLQVILVLGAVNHDMKHILLHQRGDHVRSHLGGAASHQETPVCLGILEELLRLDTRNTAVEPPLLGRD